MRRCLLPFYDERKSKIDMIVIHSVAFAPEAAIQAFRDYKVTSHYLIGEDGEIWQLAGEKNRAWHAGKSKWRGHEDINSRSIGIELCSPSLGQKPFTKAQVQSLAGLLKRLVRKYKIVQGNIVGHSDIAPTRKADPGKAFFWKDLASDGLGLWYDKKDAAKAAETDAAGMLAQIGYDTADITAAAYAFCRRFLPVKVKTVADVFALDGNPATADETLLADENFLTVLKAVYYAYCKESNTPCKI